MEKPEYILQYLNKIGAINLVLADNSRYFSYFRNLILSSEAIYRRSLDRWDFKSIADIADEHFCTGHPYFGSPEEMNRALCRKYADGIFTYFPDIDEGLPLYEANSSNGYNKLGPGNENFDFIMGLLRHGDWVDREIDTPPQWAKDVYICRRDIELRDFIFPGHWDVRDHKKLVLVKDFRKSLYTKLLELNGDTDRFLSMLNKSVEPQEAGHTIYSTKLISIQKAAVTKFWANYDPMEPDTAPNGEDVLAWLVEHGCSNREAEAIDLIIRHDARKKGGAKPKA